MNNKERMEELKSDILICILDDTAFNYWCSFDIRRINEEYNELNEKDKELEDLLYFYHIKGTDNIDEDIEINDYKDIIPCIDIYKEKGIKGVNEYLRNISNSNAKAEIVNHQTTTNDNTEKQQIVVNAENQTSNTTKTTAYNTDLKEISNIEAYNSITTTDLKEK